MKRATNFANLKFKERKPGDAGNRQRDQRKSGRHSFCSSVSHSTQHTYTPKSSPHDPTIATNRPKKKKVTVNMTDPNLTYIRYDAALENIYVPAMRSLISQELSEPYSIYVYRYFLYQWGELCYLAMDKSRPDNDQIVGVVVSKLEPHRGGPLRGYIAMLAVREEYRGKGIATRLVRMSIDAMIEREADEVCPPVSD